MQNCTVVIPMQLKFSAIQLSVGNTQGIGVFDFSGLQSASRAKRIISNGKAIELIFSERRNKLGVTPFHPVF